METTDYCVATMHMQGFSRMFRPANFAPNEADHEKVKARGEEIFSKGLGLLDKALAGKEYVAGSYSFADSAVFYVSFWWNGRLKKELPRQRRRALRADEGPPGGAAHAGAGRLGGLTWCRCRASNPCPSGSSATARRTGTRRACRRATPTSR